MKSRPSPADFNKAHNLSDATSWRMDTLQGEEVPNGKHCDYISILL